MTLQQLRYLLEISKCGSLTEAASRLFIAQPSLSRSIKDLEEEFHIQILKRGRHGTSFTAEGEQFLRFAQRILDATESMVEFFRTEDKPSSEFSLSLSSQHYMFVVDALIEFIKKVSSETRYTISINEVKTSQVIQNVLREKSQIGILYVSDLIQNFMHKLFERHNLEFIPFYDFAPFVYLRREHPLAKRPSIKLEELSSYPYVRYEQGVDPYQYSEELVVPQVFSKKTIFVTDRSTMLSLIGNTDAYNLGTGCIVKSVVKENIIAVPLAGNYGYMKIGWIKKKDVPMTLEMVNYVEHMQEAMRKVATASNSQCPEGLKFLEGIVS